MNYYLWIGAGVVLLAFWAGSTVAKFRDFHRNTRALRKRTESNEPSEVLSLVSLNPVPGKGGHAWDFSKSCCPDCRGKLFHPGPSGGMAHNIKCTGCGSKFWYGPPFAPQRAQYIDDSLFRMHVKRTLEDIA